MKNLSRRLLNSIVILIAANALGFATPRQGGDYLITKDLFAASGSSSLTSADYALALTWGEPLAGAQVADSSYTLRSGYLAGGFGNGLALYHVNTQIGSPGDRVYHQGLLQVGVLLDAPVALTFSDQLDESRIPSGLHALIARDHRGKRSNQEVTIGTTYDRATNSVILVSSPAWTGNTLYDITLSTHLINLDGAALEQTRHVYFGTLVDPHLENVVMNSEGPDAISATVAGSGTSVSFHLSQETLSDYSAVLLNQDPLLSPIRIDPAILREANAKALAAGGNYRQPLSIQETAAFDTRGAAVDRLTGQGEITWGYGGLLMNPSLVRPQTLSIWALDEIHRLWVRLPAIRHDTTGQSVSAPITRFSVFALMGEAAGDSSDSFAFPVPWRPHGSESGEGGGQTGTEKGGITFSNLPSECSIRIYTLSGDLVHEWRHSDVSGSMGQESWDVKTPDGSPVASGVYLWQVKSAQDHKNGKLMVIR